MEKRPPQRQRKKLKRPDRLKNAPKSPEFIDSSNEEEEGPPKYPRTKKGGKCLLYWD